MMTTMLSCSRTVSMRTALPCLQTVQPLQPLHTRSFSKSSPQTAQSISTNSDYEKEKKKDKKKEEEEEGDSTDRSVETEQVNNKDLTYRERFKAFTKAYGVPGVAIYTVITVSDLAVLYAAVRMGVDVCPVLDHLGLNWLTSSSTGQAAGETLGPFVIAYVRWLFRVTLGVSSADHLSLPSCCVCVLLLM